MPSTLSNAQNNYLGRLTSNLVKPREKQGRVKPCGPRLDLNVSKGSLSAGAPAPSAWEVPLPLQMHTTEGRLAAFSHFKRH